MLSFILGHYVPKRLNVAGAFIIHIYIFFSPLALNLRIGEVYIEQADNSLSNETTI